MNVAIVLSDEQLDVLAGRVADLLAERQHDQPQEDGWVRGAKEIAAYIGAPVSRVYALSSAGRIPLQRDGTALVARRSDLDAWLRTGGGRRP